MSATQPVVTVTLNPAIDQTVTISGFVPGRLHRAAECRFQAGGKGVNVASVLADFGVEVIATGFLGGENPDPFESLFASKRIDDQFLRIEGSTRIGIKIVDSRTNVKTDINLPGLSPRPEEIEALLGRVAALAAPDRWIVLSGSVPPGIPHSIYATMIDAIHAKGGRVVLDTSGPALRTGVASRPEVMKPNMDQLGELTGRVLTTPGTIREAAESLLDRGVQLIAVTMGARGAVFVERDRAVLARPPQMQTRKTIGAGDAMVAAMVHARMQDLPLDDLARAATAAGAHAVTRTDVGMDRDEHQKLKGQVEIETL
jgi:1-phosphofructokinase